MRVVTIVFIASLAMVAACSQQPPPAPSPARSRRAPEEEQSPLVGRPAPAVELELLDGSHFSLEEQKDRQVVILDFWATWCGPCVREMPIVAQVAADYRDRGVGLYCLNQAEDAGAIRAFLDEQMLDVAVGLDSSRDAARAYGVEGIPTLALIDKAGVVRGVHVGYSPDIGEKLRDELDAILAADGPAKDAADKQSDDAEPQAARPASRGGVAGDATSVLRHTADFYRKAKTFRVDCLQKNDFSFNGMKNSMRWQAKITVERPNRIAIRYANSQPAMDVVSDGERLSMSLTALKQYTQSPAPKSIDELLANPALGATAGLRGSLLEIFAEHPYERLTEEVTKTEYAGLEKLDGIEVHHLHLHQPHLNWELWIAAGDQPRVMQASFDMAKAAAAGGVDEAQLKNLKMTSTQQYSNWQFDQPTAEEAFAFHPPAGAKKIDSFFADLSDPALSGRAPVEGRPGPAVEAKASDAAETADEALEEKGLEEIWTKQGLYSCVAVGADGKTIVALHAQACDLFDRDGGKTSAIDLAAAGNLLRCARLSGDGADELLVFDAWGRTVTAYKADGGKLWERTGGQGIDDVWAADLDGDGKDEVIVGYNGGSGLRVLGNDGEPRWQDTSIANVWHVTVADLDGDGVREVVTTSAAGKIHVFDSEGKKRATLDPGIYANMVRCFRRSGESADSLLAVGASPVEAQMVALDGKGKRLWQAGLPGGALHCDSLAVAPGAALAAAGLRGGVVGVIDLGSGKTVGLTTGQGAAPQVAWAAGDEGGAPLLLAASGKGLTAWRLKPETAAPTAEQ